MPLTPFQQKILAILSTNRSEESHFAGGLVLNNTESSARYSKDFDMFHDAKEALDEHSRQDVTLLKEAGYSVELLERDNEWHEPTSFRRARVTSEVEHLDLDWAHDSAWRFFPIQQDPQLSFRLHLFDMAVNKALALSARSETRDYIDILELSKKFSLETITWAACGKDEGFSPLFLLKMMLRFAKIVPDTLKNIAARDLDPIQMKKDWIHFCDQAEAEMTHLADEQPDIPIGVVFLDENNQIDWPRRNPKVTAHRPCLRGSWPTIAGLEE